MSNQLETLGVDIKGTLSGDRRKVLTDIIEGEFRNKASLYHQIQQKERERTLEAYKKDVEFDKLKSVHDKMLKKIESLHDEAEMARIAIEETGLTVAGGTASSIIYLPNGKNKTNHNAVKLRRLLDTLQNNAPSSNLKSKLITRLQLSTTIGEANIIMREVLGNGIIPEIKNDQIEYKEEAR